MRILLVYPEFPDTFWSFKHALPFVSKRAAFPPLGLLTVAAMLPDTWEKRLVDLNVSTLTERDLAWADYAFVSAMVVQRDSTHQVIARCKKAGLKVVAGGPLFLGEHQSFPDVDHFVLNEGEVTLPIFLRDLERGEAKKLYESTEYPDIALTPIPQWDLAQAQHYASMCIQYSRGCPFNCDFCNITSMFGHRPRTKTAGQVIAELDALYTQGWRGPVFIVDDNFIGNKRGLKDEVLPALISWRQGKKGFGFSTEVSINLADDPELIDLMVQAGFTHVFVGIETPDELGLTECHKTQNKGRNLSECVKSMQRAGLDVQAGFIVGFDSDTPSIFQRQIEFIQHTGIVTAMVGLLQAIHGTELYQRLEREGRLLRDFTGNNTDNTINFLPKMDPEVLSRGYGEILKGIYAPRAYYERVRTFLLEYRKPSVISPAFDIEYLNAFARSIVLLGLRGKERLEYWKLLFWTLRHRPRLFPDAVTYAIYGFHFRRICELYVA
ncbi:MAG: B12-binding domain-containing radical SAM protein [Anaerolineae bacterium]